MLNYVNSSFPASTQPQYPELVRFLLTPLLEFPESLRIDCEVTNKKQRVWIRLALEQSDQEKLFGRAGKNLNAIRTVLKTAGLAAQQSVYLDVYGEKETAPETGNNKRPPPSRLDRSPKEGKKKPKKRSSSNFASDQPSEQTPPPLSPPNG